VHPQISPAEGVDESVDGSALVAAEETIGGESGVVLLCLPPKNILCVDKVAASHVRALNQGCGAPRLCCCVEYVPKRLNHNFVSIAQQEFFDSKNASDLCKSTKASLVCFIDVGLSEVTICCL
jgi:hypothetical protein